MSSTSRTRNVQMEPLTDSEFVRKSDDPTPEEIIMDALPPNASETLREAVCNLPDRQRSVILLLLNGIRPQSIAALFDMSATRVKQERTDAIQELTLMLSEGIPSTLSGIMAS